MNPRSGRHPVVPRLCYYRHAVRKASVSLYLREHRTKSNSDSILCLLPMVLVSLTEGAQSAKPVASNGDVPKPENTWSHIVPGGEGEDDSVDADRNPVREDTPLMPNPKG